MRENTTQHLIEDLETLRKTLSIDKWLIFGGSWGSALGLAYAEIHPNCMLGFVLRGIFLGRRQETEELWFGIRRLFPDVWQTFYDYIPEAERQDLMQAYHQRIMHSDLNIALPAARAFIQFDFTYAFLKISTKELKKTMSDNQLVLGIARTYMHYCMHNFFLKENQLLNDIEKINHLPLIIIHGRYDNITLPQNAFELHQHWPGSELIFVGSAGHSAREKPIAIHLTRAMEAMKTLI